MAIDTTVPLTLKSLGDHLWRSEEFTRNKIQNPKDYVLALLFFKRATDRYAEETARAVEQLAADGLDGHEAVNVIDAQPTAYHSLLVPGGCFWDNVRNTDEHRMGKAVNDALRGIAKANPAQLHGVFDSTDFNNKRAVPPDALRDLLDHFEALGPLTEERCPPDLLGQAYEWTIAKFAAASGKRGGEFYTPHQVGQLGARLLAPRPHEDVYDPTCGSGGLLLQALAEARRLHASGARTVRLFGQELTPETWAIARMNMLLHDAADAATIVQGDTLASPAFLDGKQIRRFDAIIANPPFSSKNWGWERLKAGGDPYGRIKHLPKKQHGEMAFVQHMVASLGQHGRMAVILPNGCFFRGGAELAVRKALLADDLVVAVIQLPVDLFYGAGIPACWLVLSRSNPRPQHVLFIDASDGFERVDTKNQLRGRDVDRVVQTFQTGAVHDGFAALASHDQIAARNYNMTVRRYMTGIDTNRVEQLDLAEALDGLRAAIARREDAERAFHETLADLGLER